MALTKKRKVHYHLLAEFIGTFFLVFWTILLSWIFNKYGMLNDLSIHHNTTVGWILLSFIFGITYLPVLFLLLWALHRFDSGCHFNPAITIGLWFKQDINRSYAFRHIIVQLCGCIVAGLFLYILIGAADTTKTDWWSNPDAGYMGATGTKDWWVGTNQSLWSGTFVYQDETHYIPSGLSWLIALLIEAVIFFAFMSLILNLNKISKVKQLHWLYLSLGLALLVAIGIPFTGAALSPVRSLASVLFGSWGQYGSYWWLEASIGFFGPIIGAILASYLNQKTNKK